MKFKKDGKVYDLPEVKNEVCGKSKGCENCTAMIAAKAFGIPCPAIWNRFPRGTSALCGYEVIEDDTPDVAEVVEKYGEDVKPDPVNRPAHYFNNGIECIEAMAAAFGDETVENFCLCNAFKYLWRHREKGGLEDLRKCRWYLNWLITNLEAEE